MLASLKGHVSWRAGPLESSFFLFSETPSFSTKLGSNSISYAKTTKRSSLHKKEKEFTTKAGRMQDNSMKGQLNAC